MSTSPMSRVARVFPIARWLPTYQAKWIAPDVLAGVTVWALVVPEAMAYAAIAGVPVQYGLYTVPLAVVGYLVFGTSKRRSGPRRPARRRRVSVGRTAAGRARIPTTTDRLNSGRTPQVDPWGSGMLGAILGAIRSGIR
jgi:hypothetical protein